METNLDITANLPFTIPNMPNASNVEFYTRNDNVQYYIADLLEVSDEVSQLVLQIETCLFTTSKQVLGQPDFGTNLENYVFTFNKTGGEIQTKLTTQIYNYCPLASKYQVRVDVDFVKDAFRDVCFIDVVILDQRIIQVVI